MECLTYFANPYDPNRNRPSSGQDPDTFRRGMRAGRSARLLGLSDRAQGRTANRLLGLQLPDLLQGHIPSRRPATAEGLPEMRLGKSAGRGVADSVKFLKLIVDGIAACVVLSVLGWGVLLCGSRAHRISRDAIGCRRLVSVPCFVLSPAQTLVMNGIKPVSATGNS